jgi:xanthine dehydrogenase large subunit
VKHIDSLLHVRGESQYVDDVPPPPEMLHAAVAGSPTAHGIITRLDTAAARAAPGVVAVLTAADIPGVNRFGPIIKDEELLVDSEVCFIGHPITLVVARTAHQARQARDLVEVEIDELPVVVDPREAFANGDLIHPPRTMAAGDVAATWGECDVVVKGRCEIGGQEHLYLETQRARAVPGEDGAMRVFSSTQGPAAVQHVVAAVLGRPMHKVEVDVKRLGGGFGGKEDQATHWAAMAALAAARLGAPVELVLNRLDDIRMTGKRHPYSADFRIGLTADGKILAYEATFYQNSGAFADLSPPVLARTLFHGTNAYYIPNVRLSAAPCRTNLQPHTAFRGFGGPQGMYVIEAAIAKAADIMGIDAAVIQRANLLRDGDVFHYGQVVERCRAERTWDELGAAFGVDRIRQRVAEHNRRNFAVKKGCALMPVCFGISFTKSHLNQGNALVHVYADGSVSVTTGGIEMGQGISSNVASVVASTFGISRQRVRVESTNTTRVANMSPSAASATTDLNGNAAIVAVESILDGMRDVAAVELRASDPDAVTVADEQVQVGGKPAGMSWTDLVGLTYRARRRLSAHGYYTTPGIHYDEEREHGHPFAYHVYGSAVFEVTVDCLRGTYAVDQVKIVHDLGRTINPTVDRGQVEGGLAQGMGWMTMEDLQWDAQGRCLSHALSTYKAPDVYFMPDDMAVRFLEPEDNPHGPLGAKAVGEPPLMYGIGVFFALRNAMQAFRPGADLTLDTPMTPERLLLALHDSRGGGKSRSEAAVLLDRL